MSNLPKKINYIKWFFIIAFLGIGIYLLVFNFFQAKYIYSNSYNKRLRIQNTDIVRGDILDRNDTVLASSKVKNGNSNRVYEFGRHFSHIIGYHSQQLGSTGIEALYDKELTSSHIVNIIKSKINNEPIKGNTVKLTLDKTIQVYASELLGSKKGSLVALNPKTGEVLALVSKPDFNPSKINANWNSLIENENSPLLNRAIDGLYPPGSIFKIITTSAALYGNYKDLVIDCTGSVNINGYEMKDSNNKGHGTINLDKAFTLSCNSYFVNLGLKLGSENMYNEAVKFKFNKKLSSYVLSKTSNFNKKDDEKSLAQQSIGQGDVLITPIHAASIAAIIANDGVLMPPYTLSEIIDMNGNSVKISKSIKGERIIDSDKAKVIKDMMSNVVKSGTGKRAKLSGIDVAGKTGTAENPHGKPHSWFIGFAPAEDPQIAIAVIIENGGSGGSNAAPIAGKVIKKALANMRKK